MTGIKLINRNFKKTRFSVGSALILAVVLTSLLAIVGVMFLLKARIDKIATSAVSENKDLNLAIDSIITKLSRELAKDVPGEPDQEYYDYPDVNNPWLASLEPEVNDVNYWRQISDVYNLIVHDYLQVRIIPDYQSVISEGREADADGDGVADSKWVKLPDMTSSKAKSIYAAIRVIDNSGMINVNTAYAFDPNTSDGSSQSQINLAEFARGGSNPDTIEELSLARNGNSTPTLDYEEKVIWGFPEPFETTYLPFDISDELTIRGRYVIKQKDTITRLKSIWSSAFDTSSSYTKWTPYTDTMDLTTWFKRTNRHPSDATAQSLYNMPHISTTYNIDRIIKPDGQKMFNVNNASAANVRDVYELTKTALIDGGVAGANDVAAQIAVNLTDYRDNDANVTTLDIDGTTYFGFERPCVYISEIAHNFYQRDPNDANTLARSYAIELYKPYFEDDDPCGWSLAVYNFNPVSTTILPLYNWTGSRRFHVIRNNDPNALLPLSDFTDINEPEDANDIFDYDPNIYTGQAQDANFIFANSSIIELWRDVNGVPLVVDSVLVPDVNISTGWLDVNQATGVEHSYQRDIMPHRCIRRLWGLDVGPPTLGTNNTFSSGVGPIQAHPANKRFITMGDIGMVFRTNTYIPAVVEGPPIYPPPIAGQPEYNDKNDEYDVRVNLGDPYFQQLFNYFTVFDPADHVAGPNEIRIKGRININTAPWYVIGQLPWISFHTKYYELARAIVEYRDNVAGGFKSIGELMRVVSGDPNDSITYYAREDGPGAGDQLGLPDLTDYVGFEPGDGAIDDFEEADLIFSRISNLVTVRSDVFTAYILVRIDKNGPQKRGIAILDRSEVVPLSPNGKVKVLAIHPVPDPR